MASLESDSYEIEQANDNLNQEVSELQSRNSGLEQELQQASIQINELNQRLTQLEGGFLKLYPFNDIELGSIISPFSLFKRGG